MAAFRPFLLTLLFAAAVMAGCSQPTYGHGSVLNGGGETRADPSVPQETVVSPDLRAQQSFDAAAHAWVTGRYTDAADRFRYFLHDFPDDPLRLRAEVWLARTLIAQNDFPQARQILQGLATHGPDDRARALGSAYYALSYQLAGDAPQARRLSDELVARYPEFHAVESITAEGDAPLIASMLADTRMRRSAFLPALRDLEVVERSATDEAMRAWAIASGMTITREALDDAALDQLLHGESTFQRAVAVGARVQRALRERKLDAAAGAFHAGSPSLLSHGLTLEFAALQNTLTLSGTVSVPLYGLAISLTGPDRRAGRAALGGILLAQRSFDAQPRQSDLLIEDTAGTTTGVQAAVERLCERGVPIIIGPIEASLAAVGRAAAAECRAAYFGLETLGEPDPHAWRMSFNAYEEGYALANHAAEQGARRIYLVSEAPEAQFLEQLVEAATQRAATRGVVIAGHVRVDTNDLQRSSREAAVAVRGAHVDAVLFAVSSTTATALSSHLAAEGIWPRSAAQPRGPLYLGSSFVWSTTLAVNSARYVEGMVLASWLSPARPLAQAFMRAFEETYGRAPSALEAFAYDAAGLARALLLDGRVRDGVEILRRLDEGFRVEGATGVRSWSAEGLSHAPALLQIRGGQLVGL